jgi:hypothetical protein
MRWETFRLGKKNQERFRRVGAAQALIPASSTVPARLCVFGGADAADNVYGDGFCNYYYVFFFVVY